MVEVQSVVCSAGVLVCSGAGGIAVIVSGVSVSLSHTDDGSHMPAWQWPQTPLVSSCSTLQHANDGQLVMSTLLIS